VNSETEAELAGLMGYNPVWFWIMSFIVLGIIFISIFVVLRIKKIFKPQTSTPKPMNVGYAGEIDKAFVFVSSGQMTINEACQRVSLILREFIAQQTQVPANMMTLTELRESHAPTRLLENIDYSYPIIFGGRTVTDYEEFLKFMNSSRAILDGWWN